MKTFFTRVGAGLLMCLVALLSASATLRLFIHGREVDVPKLTNMSDADAAKAASALGLNLSVENRFYSAAIAPNHVLSQLPVAGSRVRRGWQVRVTESLGGQQVNVPDTVGQTERPAGLVLRRLTLEPGTAAHIPAIGPAGIVLAQSPPANSTGLTGPHVGLLVSDDASQADAAAYVMPTIVGLTVFDANVRLASAGLHISSVTDPTYVAPALDPSLNPTSPDQTPSQPGVSSASGVPNAPGVPNASSVLPPDPAIPPTIATPPPPVSGNATISWQSPAPGRRVTRTDRIAVGATVRTTSQIATQTSGPQ